MKHRQERYSRGLALAASLSALPLLLYIAGLICVRFLGVLLNTQVDLGRAADALAVLGCTAILVIVVFLPCSLIFSLLRWQSVPDPERYCSGCGYDLTGNESGICPECGEPI